MSMPDYDLAWFEALTEEERLALIWYRRKNMPDDVLDFVEREGPVTAGPVACEMAWIESARFGSAETRRIYEVILMLVGKGLLSYREGMLRRTAIR